MPRGNLESVTPRPLILDLLSDLLESKQYGRAFEQMRKHRIDLNLIVDYVPPSYPLLVSQVQDPHWLNTLVADLKPDDVTTLLAMLSTILSVQGMIVPSPLHRIIRLLRKTL
uniref:Elongator complex protein 1 n=1 Tax=Cacopsylla melanoneura TaxID=428564 RepID=A0A8D8Y3E7_9HEMI